MLESELVEGAEYEGIGAASGLLRHGVYRGERCATIDGRDAVTLYGARAYQSVLLDTLRPVTPAPTADGDRLFSGECCWFCGGQRFAERSFGEHVGLRYCRTCVESLGGVWFKPSSVQVIDAEYDRRKSIAANAQKLVSGSVGSTDAAHRETAVMTPPQETKCTANSVQQSEPERPTADDLAMAIRRETLAAEEAKRWHREARAEAYAMVRRTEEEAAYGTMIANGKFKSIFAKHDADSARNKAESKPSSHPIGWPESSEYEGQV